MERNGKINGVCVEDDETQPLLHPTHREPIWRQYFAAWTASIISMGTGCVGGWSSSAIPLLTEGLGMDLGGIERVSLEEASWITSLINLGSLVGSIPAGQMSFYYGRRKFLLMIGILLIIGWIFIIWNGNNVGFLYLGRFLSGFAAGNVCVALAMYSNEICCDTIRGRSGAFYDMMQVFGILFVYSVSAMTSLYWSSVICLTIPVIFLCVFYWMPESPLFLIKSGKQVEAVEAIRWLHGRHCDVEKELSKIYHALLEGKECDLDDDYEESLTYVIFIRKFFNSLSKTTVKAFTLVLLLLIVQRSCGAPMVVYYTVDIFRASRISISAKYAAVFAGVSQFIFSAAGIALVDRVGRKILLVTSFVTMILCLAVYVLYMSLLSGGYRVEDEFGWIPVVAICLFVGIFRFGVGPIPWFLGAELIPIDAQRWALPTIFFIGWGIAFIWTKSYLVAVATFGHEVVFIFFMFVCILGLLHTLLIPETKGKSRLEIQQALGAPASKYIELKSNAVIIIES